MFTNRLLSRLLIVLISGFILLYAASLVFLALAAPLAQNPYNECPPNSNNIWVQLDDNNFGGQVATLSIPFDTGQVTINNNVYVNYLLGVLISEVGPTIDFNPVDDEVLKAMAIAARTVAFKNCGAFEFNGHRGIDDVDKQVYDPRNRETWLNSPTLGQAELDRYQQAIDDTTGMYLTYSDSVFDAQYRDKTDIWTDDYDENGDQIYAPHQGIYDPAGEFHSTPSVIKPGLMQVNSNHWATGDNHGETLPHWNYRQILAHYYTKVHLQDTNSNRLTPEYRWNPLEVAWSGTGVITPPVLSPGQTYSINLSLQNSGTQRWNNGEDSTMELAYYWESQSNLPLITGTQTAQLGSDAGDEDSTMLPIGVPSGFQAGQVVTLTIDVRPEGADPIWYFHNYEQNEGRPWYPLQYVCVLGWQCYWPDEFNGGSIYLPVIMRNAL